MTVMKARSGHPFCCTLLAVLLWVLALTPATAQSAAPLRHGSELTRDDVGPDAIGAGRARIVRSPAPIPSNAVGIARRIAQSARYDGFDVRGPHLLIETIAIAGGFEHTTPETIVLRGVRVTAEGPANAILHTHPGAGPTFILWSEIGSPASGGDRGAEEAGSRLERGLYLRSNNVTVYRSRVSGAADGIQIHGSHVRIVESLIEGLSHWSGQHNDGIQMLGQSADVEITRNRIDNRHPQTSCIIAAGPRIRIADNHLTGGGWVIYGGARGRDHLLGASREVVVTGNIVSRGRYPKGGSFGPVTDWSHDPGHGNVWRNNRYDDGTPIEFGK